MGSVNGTVERFEMIPLAAGANKARPYTANIVMIF